MYDCKITKSVINERQELQVSLLIKKWDYRKEEYHLLCNSKIDGGTLDFEITGLVQGNESKERKSKLAELYLEMSQYANARQESIDVISEELYKKYNIESRKELSDSELDSELEFYKREKFNF